MDGRSRRALAHLGLMLAVAGGVACRGDSGPARLPISGSITIDGAPLPSGSITFAPLDGPVAATAEVRDGRFHADRSAGATPGRYQVEIVAVRPTGRRVPHPDLPRETTEEVRDIIPPRYNVATELTAEVKPGADNEFAFALTSRTAPARSRRR